MIENHRQFWRVGAGSVLVAALLVACGQGDRTFRRWPPLPAATQSVLIMVESNAGTRLHAEPWTPELAFTADVEEDTIIRIFAYDQSMEALSWPRGSFAPLESDVCGGRPLPESAPIEVFESEAGFQWAQGPSADAFSHVRVPGRCPCLEFTALGDIELLPATSRAVSAHVFEGKLIVVNDRNVIEMPFSETATPTLTVLTLDSDDSWLSPSGELYLAHHRGVSRWNRSPGSEPELLLATSAWAKGIGGWETEAGLEVYASDRDRDIWRYDGARWTRLFDGDWEPLGAAQDSRVAASGPGVAYIGVEGDLRAVHYDHGFTQEIKYDTPLRALIFAPELGVIAGDLFGGLFQMSPTGRVPIQRLRGLPDQTGGVLGMARYPGGALYVVQDGWLGQIYAGVGACPVGLLQEGLELLEAVATLDDRVAILGRTTANELVVRFLRPAE